MSNLHDWVPSTLGHGDLMCQRCRMTNREAVVLGKLNECDVPAPVTTRKPTLTRHLRKDYFDEAIVPEMVYFVEVWPVQPDDTRHTEMVSGEDLLACAEWIDQMLQQKDSKDD